MLTNLSHSVTQRASEGKCIYLAEMWPNGDANQWLQFDTDFLSTEVAHVHPNVRILFVDKNDRL